MLNYIKLTILGLAICLAGCSGGRSTSQPSPAPTFTQPTPGATATSTAGKPPRSWKVNRKAARLEFEKKAKDLKGYKEVKNLDIPDSSIESASLGKDIYIANCPRCHGNDGIGGSTLFEPPPRNLSIPQTYYYGHLELSIFRTIKYGTDSEDKDPMELAMSDDDIWKLVHYLRGLQPR